MSETITPRRRGVTLTLGINGQNHQGFDRNLGPKVVRKLADIRGSRQESCKRDIKPGNIMVERRPDGTLWPYLMDFGLAREVDSNSQASTGGVEGTPAFMAPEQARSERNLD